MLAETTSEKKPFLPDCLPQNRHDGTRPPLPIPRRPLTPSRHAVLTPQNASRHAPALPSALSRHFLPRCPPRGAGGGNHSPRWRMGQPPVIPVRPLPLPPKQRPMPCFSRSAAGSGQRPVIPVRPRPCSGRRGHRSACNICLHYLYFAVSKSHSATVGQTFHPGGPPSDPGPAAGAAAFCRISRADTAFQMNKFKPKESEREFSRP